ALVLGGLRTLHIHHQTELQERLEQTRLVAEDLADGLERAVSEIDQLEQRVATDSTTLATFLHSLARLEMSDRRSPRGTLADVIRLGVGATTFAIYLKEAGELQPYLGSQDGSNIPPANIPPLSPELERDIWRELGDTGSPVVGRRFARTPVWAPI